MLLLLLLLLKLPDAAAAAAARRFTHMQTVCGAVYMCGKISLTTSTSLLVQNCICLCEKVMVTMMYVCWSPLRLLYQRDIYMCGVNTEL